MFSTKQGSDFSSPRLERFETISSSFLGEHSIFERQVLEEMKYKAPIEFTLELLEQWMPLQHAVESADSMLRVLDELESLFAEREQKLDLVLQLQKDLTEMLVKSNFVRAITASASSTLDKYSQYITWLQYRESIEQQIEKLRKLINALHPELQKEEIDAYEEQIRELADRKDDYDAQIHSYVQTARKVIAIISDEGAELSTQSEQKFEQMIDLLQSAKALDNTIKIKYELYLKNNDDIERERASSELEYELSKLDFDDSMIRGESFYNEYVMAVSTQRQAIASILTNGLSLGSKINKLVNHPNLNSKNPPELLDAQQLASGLSKSTEQYKIDYEAPARLLSKWEVEMNASSEVRRQMAQYESEFQEALSAFDTLESISGLLQADWDEAHAEYEQLNQRFQNNYTYHTNAQLSNETPQSLNGSGRKQVSKAASLLSSILREMNHAAVSLRDHVYMNEYVMNRFTSFPIDRVAKHQHLNELLELSQQEIEYIIYGIHEPLANVLLAAGEIFVIRLAIRTIEGLIANRGLSHPLLILGAAIVYGVRHAAADMNELIQKGTTELSRYAAIKIDYDHYLRMFLLLHAGNKQVKLSRIIALIEQDLDLNLLAIPTSITVQAELSMKLWALPGIAEIAGAIGPNDSEVNGNVYKRKEVVTASY